MKSNSSCSVPGTVEELDVLAVFRYILGQEPQKITGTNAFFLAPWRDERTASVAVKISKPWAWFDHGEGVGGNAFDLLEKSKGLTPGETIAAFREHNIDWSWIGKNYNQIKASGESRVEIVASTFGNHSLQDYLRSRRFDTANRAPGVYILSEQWQGRKSRIYFYMGVRTHKGGWAVRNGTFKGFKGHGGYTLLPNNDSRRLFVFEGFMDYWAYWLLQPRVCESNVLILNSVANVANFDYAPYESVYACLDIDDAGLKSTDYIRKHSSFACSVSVFLSRTNTKDWADFWTSKANPLPA